MTIRALGRPRLSGLVSFCLVAATFAFMAAVSWLKWPDVMVDYGRELYVPWRIASGEMLYRDIPHLYGPLAHYVDALLFRLFGVGATTLIWFNLLVIGATTLCIHDVFRRATGQVTATLCSLTFVAVFAFARYGPSGNYNFVTPYAHEVTYGVALFFLLVRAVEAAVDRPGPLRAAVAGVLLGLIFLTKVEIFAAAALAVGVALLLPGLRSAHAWRLRPGVAAAVVGGFAAPTLAFVALFSTRAAPGEALAMVLTGFTALGRGVIVGNEFYLRAAGLDRPGHHLAVLLRVTAVCAALALAVAVAARVAARFRSRGPRCLFATGVVLALGIGALLAPGRPDWLEVVGRPLPLFSLGAVVGLAAACLRRPRGAWLARSGVPALMIATFSLLLLAKILLHVHFSHYGFALAMPAALVFVALATHGFPRVVERWGGCRATASAATAAIVLLGVAFQVEVSLRSYDKLTYPIGDGPDRFYTLDPSLSEVGPIFAETLGAIEALMPADAGFVVLPEGVLLNYLARRRNPGRWFEFTPHFVESMGEGRMLDDLEAARPDFVLLLSRPTAEFGADYFGTDYGFQLKAWIKENYAPVHLAGARVFTDEGFGIAIATRKESARRSGQ